jgi:hypothetical protein
VNRGLHVELFQQRRREIQQRHGDGIVGGDAGPSRFDVELRELLELVGRHGSVRQLNLRDETARQTHLLPDCILAEPQQSIVKTLKALPSHDSHEYLFPSRPTARFPEPQRPYRWDFGKQFRALPKAAGIQNVRIHDLRHAGATILMTLRVPDPIVRKVTGHRSRELERYQHLTPELRALTVNLIATELFRGKRARKERESGTPTGTVRGRSVTEKLKGRQRAGTK